MNNENAGYGGSTTPDSNFPMSASRTGYGPGPEGRIGEVGGGLLAKRDRAPLNEATVGLFSEIGLLESTLSNLERKLEPVMFTRSEEVDERKVSDNTGVQAVDNIVEARHKLSEITRKINHITNRLAV